MNLESNDRKRWIEKTLEVFSFFIKLCEDYRLTYFIAYGSAIGTIRHHGFIPWDDDIDVIMPRPDYERLVHIFRKEDMGRYELVTATNTPNYYLPFTKLCDKTTTVYEDTSYRCVIGVFIDIFVLDGIINNPDKIEETGRCYEKYWRMFLLANSYYTITDIFNRFIMKKRIRIILKYVKYSFNRKKYSNQAIKRLEELTQQYDYSQCEYVVKNPRMSGNRDIFPKAWFEDKVMMPFESLQVAIPFMYHHWLSHIYGNYMQLPPEDQRISNHTFVYYNLDRRLELNEVLDEVKRMDKLNKK